MDLEMFFCSISYYVILLCVTNYYFKLSTSQIELLLASSQSIGSLILGVRAVIHRC